MVIRQSLCLVTAAMLACITGLDTLGAPSDETVFPTREWRDVQFDDSAGNSDVQILDLVMRYALITDLWDRSPYPIWISWPDSILPNPSIFAALSMRGHDVRKYEDGKSEWFDERYGRLLFVGAPRHESASEVIVACTRRRDSMRSDTEWLRLVPQRGFWRIQFRKVVTIS